MDKKHIFQDGKKECRDGRFLSVITYLHSFLLSKNRHNGEKNTAINN
jgi:hypothetical protein